mmetsp:Transcript_346/g.854  ORF Transcript_346/g.854 Transcript_346/m.854 type:complete len:822 (+) Transcript_346:2496-4961(+)|eukprot:CAMPEP_0202385620 /NCGR_PEP_ID=MMETSP1127-20130417/61797_1 /ASSEMBLY_ACC=CAM_ASM_000462 /TAXON_ID=3047 /ORGANISM="Dunaliella tertiolecta, Strain CCMP1320" /LENGTH=821 /DNA_ID=CAMNT_0048985849 /DNA_START=2408 /DNA_END=4873 /DNA_ORIENTATION=+
MFAKLTALVGGYNFPYELQETLPHPWGQWTHYRGVHREDGSVASVFKVSAVDPNDKKLVVARNGVRRLKMLRHPNILAFKDSAEVQEKGATVIYLVTQPVRSLKTVLEELDLQGQHRDEYLAMGILHITNAVSFLNNDCKLIHGNICMDAVVVTDTLDWKLHGFDLLSEHALPPDHCLAHGAWLVGSQYKPAEVNKGGWDVVAQSPPWAVDAWGLGCFMQEAFSRRYLQSVENLRQTDCIPQALLGDYQKLLSSTPSRRLNPAKVAECKFLNNRLVGLVAFLENISVKDLFEKESFFKRLTGVLEAIPSAVLVQKVLPLLSHALEFGGAPPHAISPLLQIGNTLDSHEFNKRVVPTLSKMFASPDRTVRKNLLESIDTYVQNLTMQTIEEQIFVHLQTGFLDSNAYIRELTLKSMLSLGPRMSQKTLNNSVLKHLSKLQVDEEPSIRANTTVLLGNLAGYLGEATCKRVLLNAFTRALKDSFPPAKIAGLRAMVATAQYHSAEDAALRILPAVSPLAVEPVGEVRGATLQVLECFTTKLKEADAQRARDAQAAMHAGMPTDGAAHSSSLAAGAAPALASGSAVLTWAMSSLMSSTGLAVKPGPTPAPPAPGMGSSISSSSISSASLASGSIPRPPTSNGPSPAPQPAARQAPPASSSTPAATDGWGDLDDDFNEDEEYAKQQEEEARARSRLTMRNQTSATTSSNRSSSRAATSAAAKAADGWDDELPDVGVPSTANAHEEGWPSSSVGRTLQGQSSSLSARRQGSSSMGEEGGGTRPAAGSSSQGVKPTKLGIKPKLGVQKLGAQKLGSNKDLPDLGADW